MILVSPIFRLAGKIASLLLYVLTLCSAYGGFVNPEHFALPSILILVMPYLVILTILTSIFWFWKRQIIFGALGVVTILGGWGAIEPAVPISWKKPVQGDGQTFTLLTFNCLHLDDIKEEGATGRNRAVDFLISSGADVICLQELRDWDDPLEFRNLPKAQRDSLFALYPYRAGTSRRSDLKVLSKYPVTEVPEVAAPVQHNERRFSYFRLQIDKQTVGLINMHLASYSLTDKERRILTDIKSPGSAKTSAREFKSSVYGKLRDSFIIRARNAEAIINATSSLRGPLIVCGDFNDVPSSWAYRKLIQAGFGDAYADTSFGPTFTYNQHLFFFHIDQIFYRGPIQPLWVKRQSLNTSDHYPLMAEFELQRQSL